MAPPSGIERRLKPRFNASLRCTLSLPAEESDILFPGAKLECRTRDLSESGVGLVAPSIYLGYTCVVDEGRALRLELETGGAIIRLGTTPAHYLRLDDGSGDATYLIGLRINEAPGEDLNKYLEFLKELMTGTQT